MSGGMRIFICGPKIYEFQGWLFEYHYYHGPWPLTKDGDPRKRAGRKFWKMITAFDGLSEDGKKRCKLK